MHKIIRRRALALCCALLSPCAAVWSEAQLRPISAAQAARFGVPQLRVAPAAQAPVIDGRDDDAVWKQATKNVFVHSINGGRINPSTTVRVAYDQTYLYVFFRAVEAGQETHRHHTNAAQDPAVHDGDAVEVFLQPGGPGAPYFQVAANPRGGYIDYHWTRPGESVEWDSRNLRVAGHIDFDFWTLELAIAFADLGVETPQPGAQWRANFCRNELPGQRLYGAWSFTGGGFQNPERFGVLDFAGAGGATADGRAELMGSLVEADGRAIANAQVKAFGRIERSDEGGHFRFADVPTGEQVISVVAPAYESVHGVVAIGPPRTDLAPIALRKIDPFRPAWTPDDRPDVTWLSSSLEEPPDMVNGPPDALDALAITATPGEYESVALAFYAPAELAAPRVEIGPLTDAEGRVLDALPRVRWTQRLLKREHYQTSADNAEFVWRFLWDEPPGAVKAGQVRQLVITLQMPPEAQAGHYSGRLRLKSRSQDAVTLPLHVRVLPFSFVKPAQRVGTYFNFARGFDDAGLARMMRDIVAHGGDALVWGIRPDIRQRDGEFIPDLERMRRQLLMQQRAGIKPPYVVNTSAENLIKRLDIPIGHHAPDLQALKASDDYRETYRRFVKALRNLQDELGIGTIALSWSDEIFQTGRLEPWVYSAELTRAASDQPIYITHHSGDRDKIARIDAYTDIRCYHGRRLDDDYPSPAHYDELRAELEKAGDVAWAYYNIVRTDITPEFTRLVNGYWLWRTPVSVHVPWTYYAGDPDDMVGVRSGAREAPFFAFAAPHPSEEKMVSTLDWECFREGYDDMRYIATLEAAIREAPPAKSDIAQSAQALLDQWWAEDPRVPVRAAALSADDYRQRRAQMAEWIVALQSR